jgi:hypothetical protein
MSDEKVRAIGSHSALFDGMCWPLPDHQAAWRIRFGNPTKADMAQAAREMDAYATLLVRSQKQRNALCENIKKAYGEVTR